MASTSSMLLGTSLFPHTTRSSLSITTGSVATARTLWHKNRKLQCLHSYKFIHGGCTPENPKRRIVI
ncbi:hypothetical protein HN51_000178 [Arachis hypogaea]